MVRPSWPSVPTKCTGLILFDYNFHTIINIYTLLRGFAVQTAAVEGVPMVIGYRRTVNSFDSRSTALTDPVEDVGIGLGGEQRQQKHSAGIHVVAGAEGVVDAV